MAEDQTELTDSAACPWCSAPNAPEARRCGACGASIAQRDDLGGVVVPGVTGVDPNLLGTQASLAGTLLRGQAAASAIYSVSQVNTSLGMAGAAAVLGQDAVKDFLGLNDADLERVGKPSEAALAAAARLDREVPNSALEPGSSAGDESATNPGLDAESGEASDRSADQAHRSGDGASTADPWADLPNG